MVIKMEPIRIPDPSLLSERKKQILKAIVEAHVELGEPVGSKYLTSGGIITCSSATIRNEMAELEEMGYLEQPHTSAGRIPSEAGYRLYVDSLLERYRLTEAEIAELKQNGVSFGATSVGRDGESTDLVTNTVKPGIFVYKGTPPKCQKCRGGTPPFGKIGQKNKFFAKMV